MALVLSLACTLAAHDYYFMQLPPILPSICPFTHPYVLISALSMYLPPALWAWIRAPATHFLGARILTTSTTSTPPAAFSALPQHLPSRFSVILLSSQYLFQRGPIWVVVHCSHLWRSLPNMVIKSFQMPIGNGHWESNFFNGVFQPSSGRNKCVQFVTLEKVWGNVKNYYILRK